MDVILLTSIYSKTNEVYRPMGVYQLAWWLRKHSFEVQVIDYIHRFTKEELVQAIEHFITPKTKVIGFGAMFNKKEAMAYLRHVESVLKIIKQKYPHIILTAGGVNIENINKEYKNGTLFDYFFYGHAENTMLSFCRNIFSNGPQVPTEIVQGNKVIREGADSMIPAVKFNIQTDAHIWADNDYIQQGESLPIELARGCIFACKYCRYPYIGKKKNDYLRDMEMIREEMITNYNKWKVTNYYLLDDTFNDNQVKLRAFIDMIRTLPFKVNFSCYMRPDLLHAHEETTIELADVGLASTFLGVESLNEEAAAMVGKSWSGKKAKDWLPKLYHDLWKGETTYRLGFIAGLPPDTFRDLMNTHKWMVENRLPNWIWHGLNIQRDASNAWTSEFDRDAEKYGFEWYVEDGAMQWRTPYATSREANDWATALNTYAKPFQKQNCWTLIELGSLGYDVKDVRSKFYREVDWEKVGQQRNDFFQKYKAQLLS